MAAPKGHKFATGRPKGSGNKANQPIRDAIVAIVEGAMPDFVSVLADMRETNPVKYAENIRALMEYTTPKLRSTDTTIELGEDTLKGIEISIKK